MKTQIFLLAALVMVVALGATVLPAMAAEDSSTGSFTLDNAAPNVTSVALYNATHANTETSMTPQTEYAVMIEVSDTNTMNDIDFIEVVIQSQTYGGSENNMIDQATYKYTKGSGWSLEGPVSTSWSDATGSQVPGDLTGMSGTWWLHFTPGKIAREGLWDITVTAQDYGPATDTESQLGLSMEWYGELTADDTSFGFGTVDLGDVDKPITSPTDNDVDVTAIANGNYKLQSKSANWVGQGAGAEIATLDWDGTLESGHFQLENDGGNTSASAEKVMDSYGATTITDYTSVAASTTEMGDQKDVYAWVSLAADGFIPQQYNGTFTVGIATD